MLHAMLVCSQVLVDGKNFQAALEDYATAIELTPGKLRASQFPARQITGRRIVASRSAEGELRPWESRHACTCMSGDRP